jgi:hypothetical protein
MHPGGGLKPTQRVGIIQTVGATVAKYVSKTALLVRRMKNTVPPPNAY